MTCDKVRLQAAGAVLLILVHLFVLIVAWTAAIEGGASDAVIAATLVTWLIVSVAGISLLVAGTEER